MENQYLSQFVNDLHIENCIIQAGLLNCVEILLTSQNCEQYLHENIGKDLYFLGGVDSSRGMQRARDEDIILTNHWYLDFDIRNEWRREYKEELSDSEVKDIAVGILYSLSTHPILCNWRYGVFSGNGLHAHYFGKPISIKSKEHWKTGVLHFISEAEKVAHMRPDQGVTNPARLCRLPGSVNHKGGRNAVVEILDFQNKYFDLSLIETMSKEVRRENPREVQAPPISEGIPEGERNTCLISIAGLLRRRGLDEETIFESLCGVNRIKCKPPLPDSEVKQIAKNIMRYEPKKIVENQNFKKSEKRLVVVRASDVEPEEINWLWYGRLALGKLSLIVGNPGQGKSYASCAITAAVTLGRELPGHTGSVIQGNVLMFAVEDGIADTIRPRLDVVGADTEKVQIVTGVEEGGKEKHISLENELELIEEHLKGGNYNLIVLDPINAYLGGKIDSYKDSEIRSVLSPLAAMAERNNVAVLCIMHLNKSQGTNVLFRVLGSIGYVGVARTVLFVGEHPTNYQERIIDCVKSNIGNIPPPIAFEIDDGRFSWIGETDARASDVLSAQGDPSPQSKVDEAMHFLLEELANGPREQKEIVKEAKAANISIRTLERAKSKLNVGSDFMRDEKRKFWAWMLPDHPKTASSEQLALLERKDANTPPPTC